MSSQGFPESEKKQIVSMRLNSNDRNAIQAIASRLFVREAELYRFAVNNLLNRMHYLQSLECTGSDLLPLFIEFREELNQNLGLKKQQLYKVINNGNAHPDKFVSMADIELLLLPLHQVRQRLSQTEAALIFKQNDINVWLECYFVEKYGLVKAIEEDVEITEGEIEI
jgi:transposase-like protein